MDQERYAETRNQSFYGDYLYDMVVPQDHFFRKLRDLIDWSRFTKKLIKLYKGGVIVGRPPFNPGMLLKIELVAYLYNLSERQVEDYLIDTLSAKFFVGLAADQPAPDHSTLTPSDTPVPSDTPTPSETPTPTETATETATANSTSAPTATATAVLIPGEAQYVYDGDGNMVKSVIGDVTTYYAGSTYEKKVVGIEQVERKYYFAGSSRIAMRENGALTWLLSDNLGSTSTTAAADGSLLDVVKYTAFGEIRDGATATDYRYTGQRDEFEIGLYYYVARYYDPVVGRFISADTLIPQPGSSQAYDK